MAGPERLIPQPITSQVNEAAPAVGVSKKPARPRNRKVSEVHNFIPTTDPHVKLRVAKEDIVDLSKDYVDMLLEIGRPFARTEFLIDDLSGTQIDPKEKLRDIGQQTRVLGFVEDPTPELDGIDLTIIPSTSIKEVNEELLRSGNSALFSRVAHPEWVIQLTIPDGLMGRRGAITGEMVYAAALKLATKLGIREEDQEVRVSRKRNLNIDNPALLKAMREGEKIPTGSVKTETKWSIDAKRIPRPEHNLSS